MTSQSPLSQISCYYHPQHLLCNFCATPECSLPLCPKCINIHLSESGTNDHHIQPLTETHQMIQEQLMTSVEAIDHELDSIESGEYNPQNILQEYGQLLEKYRQEAIESINEHYDYVKRQLFEELNSLYKSHMRTLIKPLQQRKLQLNKYKRGLFLEEDESQSLKPKDAIQSMIKVNSQNVILHVEKMLQHITPQDKKSEFKLDLPRLEGIEGNLIKIVPGSSRNLFGSGANRAGMSAQETPTLGNSRSVYGHNNYGVDRIQELEQRLYQMRIA